MYGCRVVAPLDRIEVTATQAGELTALDGEGREYFRAQVKQSQPVSFLAGGSIGKHKVIVREALGNHVVLLDFRLEANTRIDAGKGLFGRLLESLRYTMLRASDTGIQTAFIDGKLYRFFVCWLRDHVHTLKGMRYFEADLRSAIELYADTQRSDGMVWDNVDERPRKKPTHWHQRFEYGNFIMPLENYEMKRIPVENDVEYLFVEGIYNTWRATGDLCWMETHLDAAIRALNYSRTSPYRWSEIYGLLKRGFTIDTWDFQSDDDSAGVGNDIMVIRLDKTRFGIMHGDNTGYVAACRQLAQMLRCCGRADEAAFYAELAEEIWGRLVDIAWNGRFFTHHVPETTTKRDLGVDEASQLSLSNAYSLSRGIPTDMAQSIVREYKRIRDDLPAGSPGEWYTIYPPFEAGFDGPAPKWEYMNGGVTPIVAGELATGAFACGEEVYAVDILTRLSRLMDETDGYLHCSYRGQAQSEPARNYTTISLAPYANEAEAIPGWNGNAPLEYNELPGGSIEIEGIPFELPARSGIAGMSPSSLRIGPDDGYIIPMSSMPSASIYLLVTGGHGRCGSLSWDYSDGTRQTEYIEEGNSFYHWWAPEEAEVHSGVISQVIGWEGQNHLVRRVAISLKGYNNPCPDKKLKSITLNGRDSNTLGSDWFVFGLTASDAPVFIRPRRISFGIPDNWGAAAVVNALVEGLAGVSDAPGTARLEAPEIKPRWAAVKGDSHDVCVAYPAGQGYVAYRYRFCPAASHPSTDATDSICGTGTIELVVTGSGSRAKLCILVSLSDSPSESLPDSPCDAPPSSPLHLPSKVLVDGTEVEWTHEKVNGSSYIVLDVSLPGPVTIKLCHHVAPRTTVA